MKIEPFDFSSNVNKIELYQHLCYYHNESDNNSHKIDEDKKFAFLSFKELYHLLRAEYKEYDKVKNSDYIMSNGVYSQYVSNIRDAFVNCVNVSSYDWLSSNLCDIYTYMEYGFEEIFCLSDEDKLDVSKIDNYIGKVCCIKLTNYNVFVGQVDIKLSDKIESISILFLGQWNQIKINDIDKIKIIED